MSGCGVGQDAAPHVVDEARVPSWRPERLTDRPRSDQPGSRLPALHLAARLVEHPRADRHDEAGLLGDGDEVAGAEQAALGVLPAQQRLDARDVRRSRRSTIGW